MTDGTVLMHHDGFAKVSRYREALAAGTCTMGTYLHRRLSGLDLLSLTDWQFLQQLITTKKPQIFAESALRADGSDWNRQELSILGDLGVAVPVRVYDDGAHRRPHVHSVPFTAELLFIPGALLAAPGGVTPCDWQEVTSGTQIDYEQYYRLYERRLLPLLQHVETICSEQAQQAVVTIPGIGCGQFAGPFYGRLGALLEQVLIDLIRTHHALFPSIRIIYYDPYQECRQETVHAGETELRVRPLRSTAQPHPQLCRVTAYEEPGDEFSDHLLFSVVAWDHVSWPGNDFYLGSRATDDGVKAAATDLMAHMTGYVGRYEMSSCSYEPPEGYHSWNEVIERNRLELVLSQLRIY
jgi:hypothetical protein